MKNKDYESDAVALIFEMVEMYVCCSLLLIGLIPLNSREQRNKLLSMRELPFPLSAVLGLLNTPTLHSF